MQDKVTLDWLYRRALTVLAELMTSDDERIALRAAQATLAIIKEQENIAGAQTQQDCETRETRIPPARHMPHVVRCPDDAV